MVMMGEIGSISNLNMIVNQKLVDNIGIDCNVEKVINEKYSVIATIW